MTNDVNENQIEQFNSEMTDLERSITRIIAQSNSDEKSDHKSNSDKQKYYMSDENQNDMLAVGNEINRLFEIANDGTSKRDSVKMKKEDDTYNVNKITSTIIKNNAKTQIIDRKSLKQRYSELSMYAVFQKEFKATATKIKNEGIEKKNKGKKQSFCNSNQKVIARMTKDEIYPYPMVAPEIKDAAWIVDQMEKLCDKHDVKQTDVVSKLILTNFKMVQSTIAKYEQQQKLVKDMGKTKIDMTKYDTSLSLDNLSKPSEKISA